MGKESFYSIVTVQIFSAMSTVLYPNKFQQLYAALILSKYECDTEQIGSIAIIKGFGNSHPLTTCISIRRL